MSNLVVKVVVTQVCDSCGVTRGKTAVWKSIPLAMDCEIHLCGTCNQSIDKMPGKQKLDAMRALAFKARKTHNEYHAVLRNLAATCVKEES